MVKALEWGGRSARLSSTTGRIPPRCSSAASHMPTGPPPTTTTSCGLSSFSSTLIAFAADDTCLFVPITIQEICHPFALGDPRDEVTGSRRRLRGERREGLLAERGPPGEGPPQGIERL